MNRTGMLALPGVCFLALTMVLAPGALAANEGQADLDKATELQVTAQSLDDLEKVAKLCESAIKKGLDEANQAFAKQLLSSTLYQHAAQLCGPIFDQTPPDRRWPLLRQVALRDLQKVVEVNPGLADAHLLAARLHALPGGDAQRGAQAAGAAVNLFGENKKKKAAALVLRGGFHEKAEDQRREPEKHAQRGRDLGHQDEPDDAEQRAHLDRQEDREAALVAQRDDALPRPVEGVPVRQRERRADRDADEVVGPEAERGVDRGPHPPEEHVGLKSF